MEIGDELHDGEPQAPVVVDVLIAGREGLKQGVESLFGETGSALLEREDQLALLFLTLNCDGVADRGISRRRYTLITCEGGELNAA